MKLKEKKFSSVQRRNASHVTDCASVIKPLEPQSSQQRSVSCLNGRDGVCGKLRLSQFPVLIASVWLCGCLSCVCVCVRLLRPCSGVSVAPVSARYRMARYRLRLPISL